MKKYVILLSFIFCSCHYSINEKLPLSSNALNGIRGIVNPKIDEGTFDQSTDQLYIEVPGDPQQHGFKDINIVDICKKNKAEFINALNISTNYLRIHPHALKFTYPVTQYTNIETILRPYRKVYEKIARDLNEIKNPDCRDMIVSEISDLWSEDSQYFIDNLFYNRNDPSTDILNTTRFKHTLNILSDSHKYGIDLIAPNDIKKQEEIVINPLLSNLIRLETSMMDRFYNINKTSLTTDENENILHRFRIDLVKAVLSQDDLSPIVVAYFVGKAMIPSLEKLEPTILFQDVICKMQRKKCREGVLQLPLYKTLDLFSSIFDKDQFLKKYDKNSVFIPTELKPFFIEIKNNKINFYKMVEFIKQSERAGYSQSIMNAYAGDLTSIRNKSAEYLENTKIDGLFSGKQLNELNFTFSEKSHNEIVDLFKENIKRLETARDKNSEERRGLLENYTHILDTDNLSSKFKNDVSYQERIIYNKVQELSSLQQIVKADRKMLAEYIQNFDDIVSTVDEQKKSIGIDISIREISIRPKSDGHIDLSRDRESFIVAEKGDILTFQVHGNEIWSPVCALKKDGLATDDLINAKIGPDGCSMRFTKGKAFVDTITDSASNLSFEEKTKSNRYCINYLKRERSGEDNLNETDIKCGIWDSGIKTFNHDLLSSVGDQKNREWILNPGYRSTNAPFPLFPVGSVLLLEMPYQETDYNKAKRIVVLAQSTSVIATETSDFYLVANDCSDEMNRQSSSLSIVIKKASPESLLANKFKNNLLLAIQYVNAESRALIKSWQISGVEVDKLYAEVENKFFQISNDEEVYKHEIFKGLFSIIVKTEIAIIEKLSRVSSLLRLIEE